MSFLFIAISTLVPRSGMKACTSLLGLLIGLSLHACQNQGHDSHTISTHKAGAGTHREKPEDSVNVCVYASKYQQYIPDMIKDPSVFVSLDDECILSVIDSIYSYILKDTSSVQGFEVLASLAQNSDGYLSEYLGEMGARLFLNRMVSFLRYAGNRSDSPLIELTIAQYLIETDGDQQYIDALIKQMDTKQQSILRQLSREQVKMYNNIRKAIKAG